MVFQCTYVHTTLSSFSLDIWWVNKICKPSLYLWFQVYHMLYMAFLLKVCFAWLNLNPNLDSSYPKMCMAPSTRRLEVQCQWIKKICCEDFDLLIKCISRHFLGWCDVCFRFRTKAHVVNSLLIWKYFLDKTCTHVS